MVDTKAGTAYVMVKPSFRGFQSEVGREAGAAGKAFTQVFAQTAKMEPGKSSGGVAAATALGTAEGSAYSVAFAKAAARKKKSSGLEDDIVLDVVVDSRKAAGQITRLRNDLEKFSARELGLDLSVVDADKKLARFSERLDGIKKQTKNLDLDFDFSETEEKLADLRRTIKHGVGGALRDANTDINKDLAFNIDDTKRRFGRSSAPIRKELSDIKTDLNKLAGTKTSINLTTDQAADAVASLRNRLEGVKREARSVKVDVDVTSARQRLAKLAKQIKAMQGLDGGDSDRARFDANKQGLSGGLGDASDDLKRRASDIAAMRAEAVALEGRVRQIGRQPITVKVDTKSAVAEIADLQAEVGVLAGKAADLEVDIDTGKAEAALVLLEQRARMVQLNTSKDQPYQAQSASRGLERVARETAKIPVDIDDTKANAELSALYERIRALHTNINVGMDAGEAKRELAELRGALTGLDSSVGVDIEVDGVLSALAQIKIVDSALDRLGRKQARPSVTLAGLNTIGIAAPAAAAGVSLVVAAVAGLAPALAAVGGVGVAAFSGIAVAAAGAAAGVGAVAAGVLPLIPRLMKLKQAKDAREDAQEGVGQSAKGVRSAQSGIGDAQARLGRAYKDAEKSAAKSARNIKDAEENLADTIVANGEKIRDAKQRVTDAIENQQFAAESAADRVADAENRVGDAQRSVAEAQKNLNQARDDARKYIQGMQADLEALALQERAGVLSVKQAQKALADLQKKGGSALEWESARLRLDQAEHSLGQTKKKKEDALEEKAQVEADGVEGNSKVLAAKALLEKAEHRVSEAVESLARARRDEARSAERQAASVAKARRELADLEESNARRVLDAERRLADAREAGADSAVVAADNIRAAQQGLADANDRLGEAQANMAGATSRAAKLTEEAYEGMTATGRAFLDYLFAMKERFSEVSRVMQDSMLGGFLQALKNLEPLYDPSLKFFGAMGKVMGDLAVAASEAVKSPFWVQFGTMLGERLPVAADTFGRAIGNVVTGLAGMLNAVWPMGEGFNQSFLSMTESFAKWGVELEKNDKFKQFTEFVNNNAPKVKELLAAIGGAFLTIGEGLAGVGAEHLDSITGFFEGIRDMDPSRIGQIVENVFSVAKVIAGVSTAVAGFSVTVSVLNGLQKIGSLVNGAFGVMSDGAELARLKLGGLGQGAVSLGADMATSSGKFREFADLITGRIGDVAAHSRAGFGVIRESILQVGVDASNSGNKVGDAVSAMCNSVVAGSDKVGLGFGKIKGSVAGLGDDAAKSGSKLGGLVSGIAGISPQTALATAGVAALAGGVVYLWKNNEDFKETMTKAWEGIKSAVTDAWAVIGPPLKEFWTFLKDNLGATINWLWNNVVSPAFTSIGALANAIFRDTLMPVFKQVFDFVDKVLGPVIKWLWDQVFSPVLGFLGKALQQFMTVATTVFGAVGTVISGFGKGVSSVLGGVKGLFEGIILFFQGEWKLGWEKMVSSVGAIIGGLWNIVRAPMQLVIDIIYNKAVRGVVNWIAELFGMGKNWLPEWMLPKYQGDNGGPAGSVQASPAAVGHRISSGKYRDDSPRRVGDAGHHYNWGQAGGVSRITGIEPSSVSSNIPAFRRGGKARPGWILVGEEGPELIDLRTHGRVYTAKDTKALLGRDVPEPRIVRSPARKSDERGLELGDSLLESTGKVVEDIVDIAVGVLKSMWDVMSDPIGSFSRLISSQLSQPGNKGSSQITGVWSKVFNKPAEWIRDLPVPENLQLLYPDLQIGSAWSKGEFYKGVGKSAKENGGKLGGAPGGTGGPAGGNWARVRGGIGAKRMREIVLAQFPWAWANADFGRTARTRAGGHVSYHTLGRAVDISPSMEIFNWLYNKFGKSTRELIFSPPGAINRNIQNGQHSMYPLETIADHYKHIHWAYDSGGVLPPGVHEIANWTGKPEPILTAEQWDSIHALAQVGARQVVAESGGGGGPVVNVFNKYPVAEPAHVTAMRALDIFAAVGGKEVS